MTFLRSRRWWAAAFSAIALLFCFAVDRPVADAVSGLHVPWLTTLADWISELRGIVFFGAASLLTLLAGATIRRPRLREAGVVMCLSVVVSAAIVSAIKPVVARPGPHGPIAPEPGESWISARWGRFPSGHTAVAVAAAQGLARAYPATALFGWTLALAVAGERIHRRVHFPSDCFAGGWIGWAAAAWVSRWRRGRTPGKRETAPAPKAAAGRSVGGGAKLTQITERKQFGNAAPREDSCTSSPAIWTHVT